MANGLVDIVNVWLKRFDYKYIKIEEKLEIALFLQIGTVAANTEVKI